MNGGGAEAKIAQIGVDESKKRSRPSSPAAESKKSVAEYLQSFKRRKAEKESRSWDWAQRVLENETDLKVGQRIYVRYQVQHILQPAEDEDGDSNLPDGGSNPIPGSPQIINSKVMWWPAVIAQHGEHCQTLKEVWEEAKNSVPRENVNEECLVQLDDICSDRPEAPVWELRYEAYEPFEPETLPVVFLSRSRLIHVTVDQLHVGPYRTEPESGSAPSDEEVEDSIDLKEVWTMLDQAMEEEEAAVVDRMPAELVQRAAEASGRLRTIIRRVIAELTQKQTSVVTGEILRNLFAEHARILDAELDDQEVVPDMPVADPISGAAGGGAVETDESLTEAPFPRPVTEKNGALSLDGSPIAWQIVDEDEECDD